MLSLNWLLSDIYPLCISDPTGEHDFEVLVQMTIIIKMIHCFCICSIKSGRVKSGENSRQELLKERFNKNNVAHKNVAQKKSFAGNESIINTGKKQDQHTESFPYSRFVLYIKYLSWHRDFAGRFPF